MRFLADESCDFAVVRALRAARHDVLAVAQLAPRADDATVLSLGFQENRTLLTEDKDFGRLVYAHARLSSGVVLIRAPAAARPQLPELLVAAIRDMEDRLAGSFVVVRPGRIRIIRLPPVD